MIKPGDENVNFKEHSPPLHSPESSCSCFLHSCEAQSLYGLASSIAIFSRLAGSQKITWSCPPGSILAMASSQKYSPVCTPTSPQMKTPVALIHGLTKLILILLSRYNIYRSIIQQLTSEPPEPCLLKASIISTTFFRQCKQCV